MDPHYGLGPQTTYGPVHRLPLQTSYTDHPPKPKSCFQRKEMPMAKRRKIVTFHSWLNLAMEDVFLGHSRLFVSIICAEEIMKSGMSSQIHVRMGWTKWWRGKSTNFKASQRLLTGFLEAFMIFHIQYGHSKENGNVWWWWLAPESEPKNVTFAKCNVRNFVDTIY